MRRRLGQLSLLLALGRTLTWCRLLAVLAVLAECLADGPLGPQCLPRRPLVGQEARRLHRQPACLLPRFPLLLLPL